MDTIVDRVADYAAALRVTDPPVGVVHECKRRVIDTFGCALGAFDAEPSRIARSMALDALWALDAATDIGVIFEAVRRPADHR